jgi:hypothetical protein
LDQRATKTVGDPRIANDQIKHHISSISSL